jgi:hypothetical protein
MGESFDRSLDDERTSIRQEIEIQIPMGVIERIECQSHCFSADMDTICGFFGLCDKTKIYSQGGGT